MGRAKIPEGRKRVIITVNKEELEEFQAAAKALHLGSNFLSSFCGEQLHYGIMMLKGIKEEMDKEEKFDVRKLANRIAERALVNYEKENQKSL